MHRGWLSGSYSPGGFCFAPSPDYLCGTPAGFSAGGFEGRGRTVRQHPPERMAGGSVKLFLMTSLLAFALLSRQGTPEDLLERMQQVVRSGDARRAEQLFSVKSDAKYLLEMAERSGGIHGFEVAVFQAPPGWESTGRFWAIFHRAQEVESDHDVIYPVVQTPRGARLGAEIPEWNAGGRATRAGIDARIHATEGSVDVSTGIEYTGAKPGRAMLFRLADRYRVLDVQENGGDAVSVPEADESHPITGAGKVVRVGGLLAVVPDTASGTLQFRYSGTIGEHEGELEDGDQISEERAYITGFWVPSLGRLPFKTQITIAGPKDWVIRSEGEQFPVDFGPRDVQTVGYRCEVPISFPKIVGGRYELAAEGQAGGHTLRSYQFAPVDKQRAAKDVEWMQKAMAFYEANLGPFPFKDYECFDGKGYYGIESYSYTLLAPRITTWAVSHEMGHTYFGGLVPCPYVRDTWNEGLTQYVDTVLFHESDEEAKKSFEQIGIRKALSDIPIAWENDGLTYHRGAYAMQMLDAEIGHPAVMKGLRALIADRVGKDTVWDDLRPYFERASGRNLKWFWSQWIHGSEFPTLKIISATAKPQAGKWVTTLDVRQSGTPTPFRLRCGVKVGDRERVVRIGTAKATVRVVTDARPTSASLEPSPYTLVRAGAPVRVTVAR